MSSPLYRPAIYSADQFARRPPPERSPASSGHMMSNMFSGPKFLLEQDPVNYTSNRWNNVPDRFVLWKSTSDSNLRLHQLRFSSAGICVFASRSTYSDDEYTMMIDYPALF